MQRRNPEVDYAGKSRGKKSLATLDAGTEAALMQTTDPRVRDLIKRVSKAYDLPLTGLTILGGKPYVNVSGLDYKMDKLWPRDKGWRKSVVCQRIQQATKENGHLAGANCTIRIINQPDYAEAMKLLAAEMITPELVRELKEAHTITFEAEGWASPDSCEGIAYTYEGPRGAKKKTKLLVENVQMMAERKASNRAKRAATSCGLTSIEEVSGTDSEVIDVPEEKPKPKKEPAPREQVENEVSPEGPANGEDRATQVATKDGKLDPKGPPSAWQWKQIDAIEKKHPDTFRNLLDRQGVTLVTELTLEKADALIKEAVKRGK